jgi:hypothetical protein
MRLVVPWLSTTGTSVSEVRFGPETNKMTWSGVLDVEVMAIGNLAEDEVTVTVRPGGRLSSEPSLSIMARGADKYAWRAPGSSPAVSANRIPSSRLLIVAVSLGMIEESSAS